MNFLTTQTNIKLVVFSADSGYVPQAAKDNMRWMTAILCVNLFTFDHDMLKRCVKNDLRAWVASLLRQ
jgi:hypothetical protein